MVGNSLGNPDQRAGGFCLLKYLSLDGNNGIPEETELAPARKWLKPLD